MTIDWTDPKAQISRHFTVKEACWLPSWGVLHRPSDEEKANILKSAAMMDTIRDMVGAPISIHCWIRPGAADCDGPHNGEDYNALVKGAPHSAHKLGLAVDWDCGQDCDDTRAFLLPHLAPLKIRMENHQGPWVHIDLMPCSDDSHRYFIP